jgi:hypothetical protein
VRARPARIRPPSAGGHTPPPPPPPRLTQTKGSFSHVVLARDAATGETVAVKLMRRGEVTKYVEAEIVNHSQLRHPHVVQFKEVRESAPPRARCRGRGRRAPRQSSRSGAAARHP